MTQEDKKELLIALCGYLPYKVKVLEDIEKIFDVGCEGILQTVTHIKDEPYVLVKHSGTPMSLEEVRPYLRPMSSMTRREYVFIQAKTEGIKKPSLDYHIESLLPSGVVVDYLNENHFDYRGLIEKGLALEAPADMYDLKDK